MANVLGMEAEHYAQRYLKQRGLVLICSNYSCSMGEIDLIMRDKEYLVFIEVRSRNSRQFGGALASIDYHKQTKLIKTAKHYLVSSQKYDKMPCRFDVVSIQHTKQQHFEVEWIPNAFDLT